MKYASSNTRIQNTVARQCDFHALTLCNCGDCANREQHECEGKLYHTREVLSCPFHLLAYKLYCLRRTEMADQLVHPIKKRGHPNWLESSHNIFDPSTSPWRDCTTMSQPTSASCKPIRRTSCLSLENRALQETESSGVRRCTRAVGEADPTEEEGT